MQLRDGQRIHIIGVGGFGMSAIARILVLRGFDVSGSDRNSNHFTEALARDGATIYAGHDASYIDGVDMVLASSAVPQDHVEVVAAREQGIPVYKRQDVLAPLMDGKIVIAVAGTHGKTTTTSMIVHILIENGLDPSYIVGGVMANTGRNAGVGKGRIFVIEADEYDNMFLGLKPDIALINNIEWDHPDFFKNEAELIASFRQFVQNTRDNGGALMGCIDDPLTRELLIAEFDNGGRTTTYGFTKHDDMLYLQGREISYALDGTTRFLVDINAPTGFPVKLPLPGEHNVQNALGAITATLGALQMPFRADEALATFKTTGRRFDIRGEVDDIIVIDDYAHHPTAIKATLEATKARYPEHRLWGVWQPHTYSRTATLLEKYEEAFDAADEVIVTDIYAAREDAVDGVNGETTAEAIQHPQVKHVSGLDTLTKLLLNDVQAPAVVIIMSAGDAIKVSADYLAQMSSRRNGATDVDSGT